MVDLDAERRLRRKNARRIVGYWLYAILLMCSSVELYGMAGILPGLLISIAWGYVFLSRSRPWALAQVLVALVLCLCVILPAVPGAQRAARRTACRNNLKQIGLALHNYHDVHDGFPPAFTTDEEGRPLHSWRVLLLPHVDASPLYSRLDLSKPWNDPANLELLNERTPDVYQCPGTSHRHASHARSTHYVAVTGEETAWPTEGTRRIADFVDGTTNTAIIVECDMGILWYEPRDLTLEEALPVLSSLDGETAKGHLSGDSLYDYFSGRHILLADGSHRFMWHGLDSDVWQGLLLIADGSGDEWDSAAPRGEVRSEKLKVGNCVRLGVFLFLAIFPLPWVWLNPRSEVGIPQKCGD